jgi:hypothetical protein
MFVQDLVKPSVKEEADQVVKKPPDQPLVAAVPPPIITESFPTRPTVPLTTNTDDWRVPLSSFYRMGPDILIEQRTSGSCAAVSSTYWSMVS